MRCAVFSSKPYDLQYLKPAFEKEGHQATFYEPRLMEITCKLAEGNEAVCAFVNDRLDNAVLEQLRAYGIKIVVLRCAGFNQVDLQAAKKLGISIARVPAYSPHAVAEHTLGLILCLNRKLHKANQRVRENNFLLDGLLGFDLYGKTVGVIGTGEIGSCVVKILHGFGCEVLMFDPHKNAACEQYGTYTELELLLSKSKIISLHCPMTTQTKHIINATAIARMQDGVMIVNTSRGGLIDTRAAIQGLKSGKIGQMALDVYEEEGELFF